MRANVEFHSFGGDLESDYPLSLRTKSRGRLVALLNATETTESLSRLQFKTFSGDVQIGR